MFSSPFGRHGLRLYIVVSICIGIIAIISVAAKQQHAARPSGGISPAANITITVSRLTDVANSADGLCALPETITAANGNAASAVTAGECAAGSRTWSDKFPEVDRTGVNGSEARDFKRAGDLRHS